MSHSHRILLMADLQITETSKMLKSASSRIGKFLNLSSSIASQSVSINYIKQTNKKKILNHVWPLISTFKDSNWENKQQITSPLSQKLKN